MPRRRRRRRVGREPDFSYFKPGVGSAEGEVVLKMEEFEAIRLKDFRGLTQEEAAQEMDVSQPTFHRILVSARGKIADALVNGKTIRVKGGNYRLASEE